MFKNSSMVAAFCGLGLEVSAIQFIPSQVRPAGEESSLSQVVPRVLKGGYLSKSIDQLPGHWEKIDGGDAEEQALYIFRKIRKAQYKPQDGCLKVFDTKCMGGKTKTHILERIKGCDECKILLILEAMENPDLKGFLAINGIFKNLKGFDYDLYWRFKGWFKLHAEKNNDLGMYLTANKDNLFAEICRDYANNFIISMFKDLSEAFRQWYERDSITIAEADDMEVIRKIIQAEEANDESLAPLLGLLGE